VNWVQVKCSSNACVEVASDGERVFARVSTFPDRWLDMDRSEWDAFLAGAKEGTFDQI
jgi:hypothetical protein